MYLLFGGSTFQVEGWRFQKGSANLISKERFVGVKDYTLTFDARDAVPDHRGTILSWALGPHIHAILSVVFEVGNGVVTPFLWTAAVWRHSVVLIVYLDDNGGAQASGFFPGQPDLGVGPVWSDTHQIRHTAHAWNNRSKRQKGVYFMEMRLFHSFTPPPPPKALCHTNLRKTRRYESYLSMSGWYLGRPPSHQQSVLSHWGCTECLAPGRGWW